MKKLLGLVLLLAIAGAVCFVTIPEFNRMVRGALAPTTDAAADFTADATAGVNELEVQFTDTSEVVGTGWTWSFGDDATHIARNPKHRYSWPTDSDKQVHTFDVTLRVDGPGRPATTTKRAFITLYRPVRVDSVDGSTTPALAGSPVKFTCTVSGPPVESYSWDFGDGGTGTGASPAHAYAKPGTYGVTLTAAGALRTNAATGTTNVTVHEPVIVPDVVGKSLKEARELLQNAGLKWRVTHTTKTPALVDAQQVLAATSKSGGVRELNLGIGGRRWIGIANPAWAPANAKVQRLSTAYNRELKSGIWQVSEVRGSAEGAPVPKGSVIDLVCK